MTLKIRNLQCGKRYEKSEQDFHHALVKVALYPELEIKILNVIW